MNARKMQLQNNVEQVIDEYLNGIYDFPEEYPEMTLEECREYVTSQIYDMKSNGHGHTFYRNGICDELRFLGNEYIYKVIDEYAIANGIIKDAE